MVAAAISFVPVDVLAEAGLAAPPYCESEMVIACNDAGIGKACDQFGHAYACQTAACVKSGKSVEALACQLIATCQGTDLEPCAAREKDAVCILAGQSGTCVEMPCDEVNDAGYYAPVTRLACSVPSGSGHTGMTPPETENDHVGGDSGCSASASSSTTSAFLAGAPVGLATLMALRRRHRRRTVSLANLRRGA